MVEPNTETRKKWHCGTPVLTQKNHLLGRAKGKGGSSMAPLLGRKAGTSVCVPLCPFSTLHSDSFDATEEQKHLSTPPLLSEKTHPAWQLGAVSIGNTNWCFPDRKHSKKGRYEQCRAYQRRLLCFSARATAAKLREEQNSL